MTKDQHYTNLENMYLAAPINSIYKPDVEIFEGGCEISIELHEGFYHAARAVHGSVYFKMLDDSAFFAANSYEREVFVLTTAFTTYLTCPITTGKMIAIGKVVNKNRSQFIAESVAYDAKGKEIARGNGIFVRSKILLVDAMGYQN